MCLKVVSLETKFFKTLPSYKSVLVDWKDLPSRQLEGPSARSEDNWNTDNCICQRVV